MDYFKHYSTASDSKLINHLFDEYRHTGYAYWFLLLELCTENWDGKSEPSFKFHTRIVRQKLRISLRNLELFLTKCSTICDIKFKLSKNELEIDIPKLAEVKTSRSVIKSNKNQLTVYKKRIEENRIEEKRDEAKIISSDLFSNNPIDDFSERTFPQDCSTVLTMLNALCFKNYRPDKETFLLINGLLKAGYTLNDFKGVIQTKQNEWGDHPVFSENLRPSTLFGPKFKTYLTHSKYASSGGHKGGKTALKSKSHGVTGTPENPTGNPYTAQRLELEKNGETA